MRIRPQESAQVQARAQALTQAESVDRGRFEQALLQAAQGVRDAEGDAYAGLTPQARQALSQALEALLDKSPSELRDLAHQPGALAAFVADLGLGKSLNSAESSRLTRLLGLALPRILRAKSGDSNSPDSAPRAGSGSDQGFLASLAGLEGAESGSSFASANEALASYQGGQAYTGALAGFGNGGASAAPLGAGLESSAGTVYTVASSGSANAGSSPAGGAQGAPVQGPQASGQAAQDADAPEGGAPGGRNTGSQAAEAAAPDGEGGLPELDFQIVDDGAAWDAQPGSQVTLKGDDTWVFPQSAAVQVTRAQAPQGSAAPAPAGTVQSGAQGSAAGARSGSAEAGLPAFGFDAASFGGAAQESANGVPVSGPSRPEGGVPAGQDAESGAEPQDPADLSGALRSQSGDALRGGSGAPASGSADAQSQGQTLLSGAQGVAFSRPGEGSAPDGPREGDPTPAKGGAAAASTPVNAPATGALAAVGQDSGQGGAGSQAGAWPTDSPIPAGLAQVVAQSLRQAGAAPSRLLIQLSPSNLGAVQVELSLSDGKLTARLLAGQTDVRDALVRDLSGFKAGLESHGVAVNEVSVALGSGGQNGPDLGSRQPPQTPWRGGATTPTVGVTETTLPADWGSAYGSAAGAPQGFSALA